MASVEERRARLREKLKNAPKPRPPEKDMTAEQLAERVRQLEAQMDSFDSLEGGQSDEQ